MKEIKKILSKEQSVDDTLLQIKTYLKENYIKKPSITGFGEIEWVNYSISDEGKERLGAQIAIIENNYPKLFKMAFPLTFSQFFKLAQKYGLKRTMDTFCSMQNYLPLLKKSESAYLTANKWMTN